METLRCESCGIEYGIGQSPYCKDGHGSVVDYRPFIGYFDIALGRQIDSQADRWRAQRELNVQPRDDMPLGDLSARRDRIEQQKHGR